MSPKEFASTVAHSAAAELLRAGVPSPESPVTSSVILEECVQIIVTISRWEPMRLEPEVLAQIRAMPTTRGMKLSPLQRAVVDLLEAAKKPMKVTVIWLKLGRTGSPSGSFKSMIADLVRFGVVKHKYGVGYWRESDDVDDSARPECGETE